MIATIKEYPEHQREWAYWFLSLLGLLPALRSGLLFPWSWMDNLSSQYALPACENLFGLGTIAIAFAVGILAGLSGRRWHFLGVLPHITVYVADLTVGTAFQGFASVYALSAFAVFAYFGLVGSVLGPAFLAFVGLLVVWQPLDGLLTWPQVMLFVASICVLRLSVEAFTQNLPLAKQLGRQNLRMLVWRTLALWAPVTVLIAIGFWFSSRITSAAEEMLYERGFVERYCALDPDDDETIVLCPQLEDAADAGADSTSGFVLPRDRLMCEGSAADQPRMCTLMDRPIVHREAYYCPTPGDIQPTRRPFKCPDLSVESSVLYPVPVFVSLDRTIEQRFNDTRARMHRQIDRFGYQALEAGETVGGKAKALFAIVPKDTGMSGKSCGFLDVKCGASNLVIGELNGAYDVARERARIDYEAYVDEQVRAGVTETTVMAEKVRTPLAEQLFEFENRTRQAVDRVHSAASILQKVLMLWLIVIVIKSLLYVFARVIFDKSTDIDVDLLETEASEVKEGRIRQLQEVNVPGHYPNDLYYKANYQPIGPAPRFSIPQWRASLWSRLRFGAWNMSRVVMPFEDERGVTFNSIEGEHLIDWQLEEGEEVVFSYRNFVAMDDRIELRTVISLRVATLLLGRIVFHTARCREGHGRLILRTRGRPATADQVEQSIPAARLVAWNRYAQFSVDSHLTRVDIFLNGFNLKRSANNEEGKPRGILVVEADARDGGVLVGTLRFARNFLLPI